VQESHTKKSTRIIIFIIALVMAGGFIGSYFLLIMNNGNTNQQAQNSQTTNQQAHEVDPNAYTVTGKVAKLEITDEKVGAGPGVTANDTVRVHYKGTFAQTGVKFDSSYDRGEPATFALSNVIQGWQEGVIGMKVGGKRRLVVPSDLAYGTQGNAAIPPNSDLVFEIELLAINPK
jgi:FKBP-type peptidyl-prolyl cis-trans isomerase FkpA